jgi:hypothetical protein
MLAWSTSAPSKPALDGVVDAGALVLLDSAASKPPPLVPTLPPP